MNRDIVCNNKNMIKQSATNDDTFACAVYDFQHVLSCLKGEPSLFYYKRKLSVFNFTIYDMGKERDVTCYM